MRFIDSSSRENYLFNSTINGVEESDLILLIGTNPRFEATMLNVRIRKAYLNNNTKIISLNEIGDLTYPYVSLDGKTQTLRDIIENKNDISNEIIKSKKPIIIFGESFLNLKSAEYLFFALKDFLLKNDKFKENWNPLNLLSSNAATVGSLDLDIVDETNSLFEELNNNKFKLIYLLGRDDLNFKKKDEFIIYQGSHGDKGAEIADIILPGSAYTEQSGHFTNLEGKIQKAYKASYPPGEAKEDWQIINDLAELMNKRKLFNDKDELESSMLNYLNLKKEKNKSGLTKEYDQSVFENENLIVNYKDYYFSNVIARSSKTMLDCNNSKIDLKRTGTEG
jgi:NADH-quinone oxidoreductase subunit G